jgi:hypothetical protein
MLKQSTRDALLLDASQPSGCSLIAGELTLAVLFMFWRIGVQEGLVPAGEPHSCRGSNLCAAAFKNGVAGLRWAASGASAASRL